MRPYGASCGITLQRQLLRPVVVLQNRTGGGQGAHAVARGVVQLKALGQRDAGDFGILFQRHHADTGGVAGRLFRYECAADEQQTVVGGENRQVAHEGQLGLVAVGFQQLAAVLLCLIAGQRHLGALAVVVEEEHPALVIGGHDHIQRDLTLLHAEGAGDVIAEDARLAVVEIIGVIDACVALSELVHSRLSGETLEHAVEVSKTSITTVAMLEMTQAGREMSDEELKENPAVEQEWDIQWEIFRLLAECEERDIELIKGLRADLREAGESNIGIIFQQ